MVWLAAVNIWKVPGYLLPSPSMLWRDLSDVKLFYRHGGVTLIESVAGFGLAVVIGSVLAVLLDFSRILERGFMPYLILATNIPIVAFAPIAVIYFGFGMASKIVVAAIVSFFPVVIYTLNGLQSVDPLLRDLFESNSATRRQILFKLSLPTAMPAMFASMKIAATQSVLAAVVAEFIQASEGLGWLILTATYVSDISRVWATVVVSSMIAILFYSTIGVIERISIPWHASIENKGRTRGR